MEPVSLGKDDDFMPFEINGDLREVDVFEAYDAMGAIDRAYFARHPEESPVAGQKVLLKHPAEWIGEIKKYLISQVGFPRAGWKAADKFYTSICNRVDELKKNTSPLAE